MGLNNKEYACNSGDSWGRILVLACPVTAVNEILQHPRLNKISITDGSYPLGIKI